MNDPLTENHDPRVAVYEGCEKEPIHIPGSIQPHGALLAVDAQNGEVLQASLNTTQYLGHEADSLLGKPVSSAIGELASREFHAENLRPAFAVRHTPFHITVQGKDGRSHELVMMAHQHDDVVILEFEPYETGLPATIAAYHRLLATLNRISQSGSETELLQQTVREIQALTGYDRVMYYRFGEDGTGTVTHECRANSSTGSYLDHHFPAADIPAQARELYRRNALRFIFDTEAEAVPIQPGINPRTGRALDLSYAVFRSISPVHIEYLRNMGVRASLSISIVIDDHLEGLIACHSHSPKTIPEYLRATCHSLTVSIVSHLSKLRAASESNWINEIRQSLEQFSNEVINGQRFVTAFRHNLDLLMSTMDVDSIFLQFGSEHIAAPKSAEKLPFPVRLRGVCTGTPVYASDRLGDIRNLSDELREYMTGGMVIDLGSGDMLCLGRREYLETIVWGGDPTKPVVDSGSGTNRLNPRASFESWQETVRGKSRTFGARERTMATALRNIMMEAKALEYRRLAEEKLQLEARTDPLTGLANRNEFFRVGKEELERARRYGRELSIVYFDIDHFKAVNDNHGHDAGDRVLQRVAEICRQRLRANDICSRLGGEEFAVLLPETGLRDAVCMAESLRKQFEDHGADYQGTEICLTSSFGVAAIDRSSGETLENILKRADEALYRAKESGRNRVVSD